MNAFLTVMAVIGILVTLVVLTVVFIVVRLVLKVRRGLAQVGNLHVVNPRHRGAGADSDFSSVSTITLASGAWSSGDVISSSAGDTCQGSDGSSDGGSSGSDCGSSDGGGGSD